MLDTLTALEITAAGERLDRDLDRADLQASIRATIGCQNLETVPLREDITLWIDADGLAADAPVNYDASMVAARAGFLETYRGAAIFTGGVTATRDPLPLTPDARAWITDVLGNN